MSTPLFLYGTLLDPRVLARESGDSRLPRAMVPAVLPGFARVRFRGTLYPTLIPRRGRWVPGALIRPNPAAMAALRRYEGPCYRLMPLRVLSPRGPVAARAWVTPRQMALAEPWKPSHASHA
ncbi:gamma-glutamylcyclotransferase family protein [Roseomonas harenae]|uniref:gamma-glutamylcyclotransferase family protein n=1 Tax=Muricoccus harenae TaxID=2692566 RepID=UPI0022A7D705|nr:gamma-glutamylcyclotransferase family protein [Roseomonas harenae]